MTLSPTHLEHGRRWSHLAGKGASHQSSGCSIFSTVWRSWGTSSSQRASATSWSPGRIPTAGPQGKARRNETDGGRGLAHGQALVLRIPWCTMPSKAAISQKGLGTASNRFVRGILLALGGQIIGQPRRTSKSDSSTLMPGNISLSTFALQHAVTAVFFILAEVMFISAQARPFLPASMQCEQ